MLDALVPVAFGGVAAGLWLRRLRGSAFLCGGTALAWIAGDLGGALVFAHRGPLLQLLLAYPRGLPRRRDARVVVAAGYVAALVLPVGRSDLVSVALVAACMGVLTVGYLRSSGLQRRAHIAPLLGMACVGAVLSVGAVARLADRPLDRGVLTAYEVVLVGVAVALFVDARWRRRPRSALADLVVNLGDTAAATPLRDKLAATLGDPPLMVGYPAPSGDGLVDEVGRPVESPAPEASRTVTTVRDGERVLAVLVHDQAVLGDPALVDSVAALARVAIANIRLQAEVGATVTELEASRRRLLEVADSERERLAAELAAGALSRLDGVAAVIQDAALRDEVDDCRNALSDFARGIHPRSLTENGLAAALAELAAAAPMPVHLDVDAGPIDAGVATAAYFVCAEALTNVAKYAIGATAVVRVCPADGNLHVEVSDDGPGGTDLSAGSGLQGLADRVDVLGGTLTVQSPPGSGTRVTAVIPLDSAAPPAEEGKAYSPTTDPDSR